MTCISDNFQKFHKDIQIMDTEHGERAIDAYGIQYPHDYPTIDSSSNSIVSNYTDYTQHVLEKYQRRIERFREIFSSKEKIIILYRGHPMAAAEMKQFLESMYKQINVIFVVATKYNINMKNKGIFVCDPEINGNWNETTIWSNAIKNAIVYNNRRSLFSMNFV